MSDTYYYIKNAADPQHQCVAAGDRYDGKVYLQPHNKRTNAQWRFEPAEDGFYYIVDKSHGCALGTGFAGVNDRSPEAALAQIMIQHWDKQKRSDWAQHCRWRVQPGKKPGSYILVNRFHYLSLQPDQAILLVHLPRLSQPKTQWLLETAVEGEDAPDFVSPPEPVLDANFFEDIIEGGFGIDVGAPGLPRELTVPEAERHRFVDRTPWLRQVTRDRSIASVYRRILRNPALRYEGPGGGIENVVVDNDRPDGVVPTPPERPDADHEVRFLFVHVPSRQAIARLPYGLMGKQPVSSLVPLGLPQGSVVKLAAASPTDCYVLHAEGDGKPARLGRANFSTKTFTAIPLTADVEGHPLERCEICWTPKQGELLLAAYDSHRCNFRRYIHRDQKWSELSGQAADPTFTIVGAALAESGVYYLLNDQGKLRDSIGNNYDSLKRPGLRKVKVTSDGGVWGFFDSSPGQRICILHEGADGKAAWHPVLEPKADGSRTPNGYDDKDKENTKGIACAPVSSTEALCWPLAPEKAKRRLYRLAVGVVDQPPLRFPTYTDEEERKAYRAITVQLLESAGTDLRSHYGRINPTEATTYLAELQRLTPKPADGINPEKFRAVRDDLACELTYLVFAKTLFDELHLHVLTNQMVNDHAMAAVARAFDLPTDVRVEAGPSNPETVIPALEISEAAFGSASGVAGAVSAGLGAAAVTTASLTMAAAATGVGAAILGVVAIALAIAVAIEADKESKKAASEPPTFKVTVNDTHYEINSTLAGIQERVDQIFIGVLDQLEAWRKHVSEDLGALIVVGRLAKAQVWSADALGKGVDPKEPGEILKATQTSLKAYYEACVRTYAKALLRHFMMMGVMGRGLNFDQHNQIFRPPPTQTYPRFPFWLWTHINPADKSEAANLHSALLHWDSEKIGCLMQKGERRDASIGSAWPDMGAPVGTDLVVFLYAHGATREGIANNWDLVINDGMCIDWGHG